MKLSVPSLLLLMLQSGGLTSAVAGPVTEEEAAQIALDAVRRAAGSATEVTERKVGQRGWTFAVDDRWWVGVGPDRGDAPTMSDLDLRESEHSAGMPGARPSSAEIEAAAVQLLHKVFPDFDMAEFVLESAKPTGQQARVSAYWRRLIAECGFPGPGHCFVDFR